nr:MAG TPA: hypothetical protein [Caudoviricetes sp.]DAT84016.1 MAG TPA: hypothetical protein [Bacteriophage sp.]
MSNKRCNSVIFLLIFWRITVGNMTVNPSFFMPKLNQKER